MTRWRERVGRIAVAAGAVCAAGGCGGSGESELVQQGGFQLVGMSVQDGERTWPINRPIEFRFNRPVDFDTVNANTISIRRSDGVPATGSFEARLDPVTDDVDPRAVVFRPSCPREGPPFADAGLLPGGTTYDLRVLGRASGGTLLSRDGEPLADGQRRTFRTPDSLDPADLFYDPVPGPPRAVVRGRDGVAPAAAQASRIELDTGGEPRWFEGGAQAVGHLPGSVPLNLYSRADSRWSVLLVFDQPLDSDSVGEETVQLRFRSVAGEWRALPARVALEANCTETGAEVRLRPTGPIPPSSDLRVVRTNGLRDLSGGAATAAETVEARLRTAPAAGGATRDAFFEHFDVGGAGTHSYEDVTSVFSEARADWGGGACRATLNFDGTGGPQGTFDVVVRAGEELFFDTALQTLSSADQTQTAQFAGGVLDVRDFRVEEGAVVRVRGPNALVLRATGEVVIEGEVDVSGLDAPDLAGLALANVPHPGGGETCGSGAGGVSSPTTGGSSARGGIGEGAFGVPGLGGRGGESGYSGAPDDVDLRRPGGGGGGRFGPDAVAVPLDRGSNGLAAQPGFAGMDTSAFDLEEFPEYAAPNVGAYGAESGALRPAGGAPGESPFQDADDANDLWGRRLEADGSVTVGELPRLWAGAGGGGGGDAVPSATFPNPGYLAPESADQRGGSGGGGGGSIHVQALGDVRFGPRGVVRCDGGAGGAGESTTGLDYVAGGGGGGSGGHLVIETNGVLDLSAVEEGHRALSARGGRGGPGLPGTSPTIQAVLGYPVNRGGDGGPGVVQVHVPGVTPEEQLARILLPAGSSEVAQHSVPAAQVLVPRFGTRSRAQSRWIALGAASPASGAPVSPVDFAFGGTDPADGSVLDEDGDGFADPLPAWLETSLVAVDPEDATATLAAPAPSGALAEALANPASLAGFALRSGDLSFDVLSARHEAAEERLHLVLDATPAELAPLTAHDSAALAPRYFRLRTSGVEDFLPPSARVRIQFQATGPEGSGAPDEAAILVDWTGDAEELDRSDLPAPVAFFRFRVLFETDALGEGFSSALPRPALDFLSVPFRFGDL